MPGSFPSHRHHRGSRAERPARGGAQSASQARSGAQPFRDLADYLACLAGGVKHQVAHAQLIAGDADDGPDCGTFFFHRPGMAGRRPGRATAPEIEPAHLRARFQATQRAVPGFAAPDTELAAATGLPRHVVAALVLLRCAELAGIDGDDLKPEFLARLAVKLMGVPRDRIAEIVRAVSPGGELERRGLLVPEEDTELPFGRGPIGARILESVRRRIDGLKSPLDSTRFARPGAVDPGACFSRAAGDVLRARFRRFEQIRARLPGAGDLLRPRPEDVRVRVGWPEGLDTERGLAALATLLGRAVVDARSRPGERMPPRAELAAEAQLSAAVVLVDGAEGRGLARFRHHPMFRLEHGDGDSESPWPSTLSLIESSQVARDGVPAAADTVLLGPPDEEARRELWGAALEAVGLAPLDGSQLTELSRRPAYAKEILKIVGELAVTVDDPAQLATELLRRSAADHAPGGSETDRVPKVRLADVVLSPSLREQVEEILAVCRDDGPTRELLRGTVHDARGHTPAFLFSGAPGTGKTHTAEALAGELGRPLRRLSGADIRKKYYGESEELIREHFRAPDDAVLFFDEVDGLLKQRGGGEAAQHDDRLAVVLLEEIENTNHITVLATNLDAVLDGALARRVQHLRFEPPGPDERGSLWRLHLPGVVPGADGVDCARLGGYPMTGAEIKNASHRAIGSARRKGVSLTTELVEAEAKRECSGGARRMTIGFGR